jgi:hypothetical protein
VTSAKNLTSIDPTVTGFISPTGSPAGARRAKNPWEQAMLRTRFWGFSVAASP